MDGADNKASVPQLDESVVRTINELFPPNDPIESLDFDATAYINHSFPSQQSLSNLDDVISSTRDRISSLNQELSDVVRGMSAVEEEGQETLLEAQQVIHQLTSRIHEMKEQAVKSEHMVNEITADIKQLDNAKRNLTASIIMLNNLHILVDGVDKLTELIVNRNYAQTASILQSCIDVLFQLERHQKIPHVKELADKVESIRKTLASQIIDDFHEILEGSSKSASFHQNQMRLLAEACLVVECLDEKVKKDLLDWVVSSELLEYKALFQENQDISWLDKVDKRFNWLKKHLIEFEERFGRIFPPKWEVGERIAVAFCKQTCKDLSKVMSIRSYEINVRNLLFAVSKSTAFETLLAQKFVGLTLTPDDLPHRHPDATIRNPFLGLISHCFEPHLPIYVDAQDKNLNQLIDQFVEDSSKKEHKDQQAAEVLPSAGILFNQYKNCLVQCVQLSTGQPLHLLSGVFQRNLRDYATRVLHNNLPKLGSNAITIGQISSQASGGVRSTASAAAGLIQSFLKDEVATYSNSELITLCSIILTANYCLETTQQLEKKLQEKIEPQYQSGINLTPEQDLFHCLVVDSIQLLVSHLEAVCEQPFTQMIKTSWSSVDTPIGASPYVHLLISSLQKSIPIIRDNLQEVIKFFTELCVKFANAIAPKLIGNLFKCKNLSRGGAEQLLLDTHTMKKSLLDLPIFQSSVKSAPVTYTKAIIRGMTKAEMILKVVLVPHNPVDAFIESYLKLLPDSDTTEFMKILDMKGVKRTDSNFLLEQFRIKSLEKREEGLAEISSVLNGLSNISTREASNYERTPSNKR